MADHYYSSVPSSKHEERVIETTIRNFDLKFKTDSGVFSKKDIDFGSRLLLESFEQAEDVEGDILDVGCGYGTLGVTLGKVFPTSTIEMVDVNERALSLAAENAKVNQVTNVVIHQSSVYDNVDHTKRYAYIFSNPPIRAGKHIVHSILEGSKDLLLENGELWIVIQKKQGAPSAMAKLEKYFPIVDVVKKSKGYFIICAKKID